VRFKNKAGLTAAKVDNVKQQIRNGSAFAGRVFIDFLSPVVFSFLLKPIFDFKKPPVSPAVIFLLRAFDAACFFFARGCAFLFQSFKLAIRLKDSTRHAVSSCYNNPLNCIIFFRVAA